MSLDDHSVVQTATGLGSPDEHNVSTEVVEIKEPTKDTVEEASADAPPAADEPSEGPPLFRGLSSEWTSQMLAQMQAINQQMQLMAQSQRMAHQSVGTSQSSGRVPISSSSSSSSSDSDSEEEIPEIQITSRDGISEIWNYHCLVWRDRAERLEERGGCVYNGSVRVWPRSPMETAAIWVTDADTIPQEGGCSICLEEYGPHNQVTTLGCFHVFHYDCAKGALEANPKLGCPVCRHRPADHIAIPIVGPVVPPELPGARRRRKRQERRNRRRANRRRELQQQQCFGEPPRDPFQHLIAQQNEIISRQRDIAKHHAQLIKGRKGKGGQQAASSGRGEAHPESYIMQNGLR